MITPSAVRCLVSVPKADCLDDLAALCGAAWTGLLNPYSHVHDDLVCRVGGGEAVGNLASSHLAILSESSGTSHRQSLELVATPGAGRHVAPSLLEIILSAVLMPHVKALVPFDVSWTTIHGYISDASEIGTRTSKEHS